VTLGVLAAVGLGVGVWLGFGRGDSSDDAVAAADTTTTTSSTTPTTTTPTTTTAVVVERFVLDPGEREVATARAGLAQVNVRATPPPGWDVDLTPVVVPTPAPTPPRSGLDVDRVAFPSAEVPIAGRALRPDGGWTFANPGRYTPPQPTVFSVVARQGMWLQVLVPVRPNGTTGWVRSSEVDLSVTTLRVEVSLAERRLRVHEAGQVVFDAPISVGRPATPTPTGEFYVTDLVPSVDPAGPYGPLALALNGYSEVMDRFGSVSVAGSPDDVAPVLAIHGTNQPSSIGRAASNGCPRLSDEDILRLASLVPAGTPVEIWP
jgi:lipoprotein-anchoring transpeptidase ErfK/SrfK